MNVAGTDFLLILIKDEDWLSDAAEAVCRNHRDELWMSQFTPIELLVIVYQEERDTEQVITNVTTLLEVHRDVDAVLTAAAYIEDRGFTPPDALRLVESDGDTIVSSGEAYESFVPRFDLETAEDEWQRGDKYFSDDPDPQQICRVQHGLGGQSVTAIRQRRWIEGETEVQTVARVVAETAT